MTAEEQREQTIKYLSDMLRTTQFQVEFKVKKKPAGIKVIIEVTQEQMDSTIRYAAEKHNTEESV